MHVPYAVQKNAHSQLYDECIIKKVTKPESSMEFTGLYPGNKVRIFQTSTPTSSPIITHSLAFSTPI